MFVYKYMSLYPQKYGTYPMSSPFGIKYFLYILACETCHREYEEEKLVFQFGDETCVSSSEEVLEVCKGNCVSSQYILMMNGVQLDVTDCKCCTGIPGGFRDVVVTCTNPTGGSRSVTTQVATDLLCGCTACHDSGEYGGEI